MENPYQSPEQTGERVPKPLTKARMAFFIALPGMMGLIVGLIIPRISPYIRALWDAYAP